MGRKETLAVICRKIAWISVWISFSVFSGFGFEGDDNDGAVVDVVSCPAPASGRENGSVFVVLVEVLNVEDWSFVL